MYCKEQPPPSWLHCPPPSAFKILALALLRLVVDLGLNVIHLH